MSSTEIFWIGAGVVYLSFALGSWCGDKMRLLQMQREAIKKGVAEWVIDDDANLVFTWKKQ